MAFPTLFVKIEAPKSKKKKKKKKKREREKKRSNPPANSVRTICNCSATVRRSLAHGKEPELVLTWTSRERFGSHVWLHVPLYTVAWAILDYLESWNTSTIFEKLFSNCCSSTKR